MAKSSPFRILEMGIEGRAGIEGWTGRWRTMGVALNRFLGTFIVLENVENRIKTLFWDSHRSGEESTRAA